jgi:antitoxin ParD1/3/4
LLPKIGNITRKYKILGRNTSVSLGEYFEHFVENKIKEGRFKNASEVLRAGLRLLEEEENQVLALKNAIREGSESGIAKNFDPIKHLESLKALKRKNG